MPATSAFTVATNNEFPHEFEALFQAHYDLVYCTAYSVTGRVEDAEDVAQSIFLRILKRKRTRDFMQPNPRGYLYRAAVNESLTVVEARQRRERRQVGEEAAFAVPAHVAAPADDQSELYAAIARLNRKAAQILILRHIHDYTDSEIAQLLGTSRGVIAVTLYRARRRLRTLLGDGFGDQS